MLTSIAGKLPLICHHQCLISYVRLGQISNFPFAYLVAGMQKSGLRQMDKKLLSSLMRSLTYDIIFQGDEADGPASLGWVKLTCAVSVGGCHCVLSIQIQESGEESESDS